jgi:hypothetical protein
MGKQDTTILDLTLDKPIKSKKPVRMTIYFEE